MLKLLFFCIKINARLYSLKSGRQKIMNFMKLKKIDCGFSIAVVFIAGKKNHKVRFFSYKESIVQIAKWYWLNFHLIKFLSSSVEKLHQTFEDQENKEKYFFHPWKLFGKYIDMKSSQFSTLSLARNIFQQRFYRQTESALWTKDPTTVPLELFEILWSLQT